MEKSWVTNVLLDDESGEYYIQFTDEQLEAAGLQSGDVVEWIDNKNGSWTLRKKVEDYEWVLVETVNTFRERYMVQVPKGNTEWALDTVVCNEAKEFSQEHIGEQIVSHRVITQDEALDLCDKDNEYCKTWNIDKKLEAFFTTWKEQNDAT